MTEIDYWPSIQVPRSAAFYLKKALAQSWTPFLGDATNIRRIEAVKARDDTIKYYLCEFNSNPRLDPPEWETWKLTPEQLESGTGGTLVSYAKESEIPSTPEPSSTSPTSSSPSPSATPSPTNEENK